MGRMIKGAMAPPIEEPLSNRAVARPRSDLGNHSATVFVAAGQLADSPAPNKNRNPAKLAIPRASAVDMDTNEYQATLRLSPRRVPIRSITLPKTVWPIE